MICDMCFNDEDKLYEHNGKHICYTCICAEINALRDLIKGE